MSCIFEKSKKFHGPLNHVSARHKLLGVILFNIFVLTSNFAFPIELFAYTIIFAILLVISKLPFTMFLKRLLFLLPLFLFITFAYIINLERPNNELREIFFNLKVREIYYPFYIFWKAALSIFSFLLLAETTDFDHILKTLKNWHVPDIFILMLMITYYYIDFFIDSVRQKVLAYNARKYDASLAQKFKALTNSITMVFLNTYQREQKIFLAGKARGFIGKINFMVEEITCAADCMRTTYFFAALILVKISSAILFLYRT